MTQVCKMFFFCSVQYRTIKTAQEGGGGDVDGCIYLGGQSFTDTPTTTSIIRSLGEEPVKITKEASRDKFQ